MERAAAEVVDPLPEDHGYRRTVNWVAVPIGNVAALRIPRYAPSTVPIVDDSC